MWGWRIHIYRLTIPARSNSIKILIFRTSIRMQTPRRPQAFTSNFINAQYHQELKNVHVKRFLLSVLAWVRTNEEEVKPNLLIRSINEERKLFSGLNAFACLAMAVLNLNLIFARFTCSSFGTLIHTNVGTFNKLIVLHTLLTSERMSSTLHISALRTHPVHPIRTFYILD